MKNTEETFKKIKISTIREYIHALYLSVMTLMFFFSLKPPLLCSANDVKISAIYLNTCTYI